FISTRRDGRSLGDLVKSELGKIPGVIALFGAFMIMVIILAVLALIAWLGFSHPHQSAEILTAPVMLDAQGNLAPVSLPLIVAMVGVALFSYNGYGAAVYMAEDMREQGKPMAVAIMLTLVIVVLVELVPFTALLIGSPSLAEMAK
ncbi:amino acid permease, partial [Escherichia coli]|uniref:amino acid permease n=1 Tax=Escherichia coli TaxID=562 RepID=UPI002285329B